MKMLADSPLPDTSPIRKNSRRSSSRKKSYRSPPTSRAGSIDAARSTRASLQRFGARQRVELDALRRLELAGDARALLALPLDDLLQRLAVARRRGERQHEQHAEQQQQSRAPASRHRTAAAARERRIARRTRRTATQREREQRHVADGPARRHPRPAAHPAAARRAPRRAAPSAAGRGMRSRSGSRAAARGSRRPASARRPASRVVADAERGHADQHQLRAAARFRRCRSARRWPRRTGPGRGGEK